MSADANFRLDAAALIRHADHYGACADYHAEAGESRHYCAGCGAPLAHHVVRALLERVRESEAAHVQPAQ